MFRHFVPDAFQCSGVNDHQCDPSAGIAEINCQVSSGTIRQRGIDDHKIKFPFIEDPFGRADPADIPYRIITKSRQKRGQGVIKCI